MTDIDHVYAVIGGFHLVNAPEEIIDATIEDLRLQSPDYLVPTHCTGFEAIMRFSLEMPEQFLLNTVGTTYIFGEE
jgi:7,8-dihydropterin-6-yl-methyl-4-(beta-D-ribofuranosyl)aminobenzene 5'-phosphate synthase